MVEYFSDITVEKLYLFRFFVAGICGLLIGAERRKRQKDAGLRTHFIVAAASSLMTCVSLSFGEVGDGARIAAQIVAGIGFLGAGVIFFRREALHGLTTAAGVWATAGIGMAVGIGLYFFAIASALGIMLMQFILYMYYKHGDANHLLLIKLEYYPESILMIKQYFEVNNFERFKAQDIDDKIMAEIVIRTHNACRADYLTELIKKNKFIKYIERLED